MALILFIETGTRTCSVALAENETLLTYNEVADTQSHAKVLHQLIEKNFADSEKKMSNLNAVVVGAGPGSYTGLRIGMAAAKGLAFTLDIPFIALDTLKALASEAIDKIKDKNAYYMSTLNSRKGEIYYCILNGKKEVVESSQPAILTELNFAKYQKDNFIIIHNDKGNLFDVKYKRLIIEITAKIFIKEGFESYKMENFDNIVKKNPLYLKPFF